MPESEQSFLDRLQKARDLQAAVATFTPAFAPVDVTLSASGFLTTVTNVTSLNTALDAPATTLSDAIAARIADAKLAKTLTTQIVAHVKSNSGWKLKYPRIKALADKVRGFKAPRKTPPPGAAAAPKPRDRGEMSYAECAANFSALVGALGTLPGYLPPDNAIKLTALTPLSAKLGTNNAAVAAAEQDVTEAQRTRFAGYYAPGGLQERFGGVKTAVKGQYGQNSAQWGQVKGMKW